MATFAHLKKQTRKTVDHLVEFSGLDRKLVENVFTYGRCLPKKHSKDIEENIFTAQMLQHFGLTSKYMISLMYRALKGERNTCMDIESYCRCICTFLSNNLDRQIDFAFTIYDVNVDGVVSFPEMYTFLKPCVIASESEDMDREESLRDLIEIVIGVTDKNASGEINLEAFRKLVKANPLYLQMLGPCLPTESHIEKFRAKLKDKSTFDVRKQFEAERFTSLNDPPYHRKLSHYPVVLDLP